MRAYVVVTVGPDKAGDAARQITSPHVAKMANACWGDPDVCAVVEVAESRGLNKLVIDKIQKLEGVGGTSTHRSSISCFSGASSLTDFLPVSRKRNPCYFRRSLNFGDAWLSNRGT